MGQRANFIIIRNGSATAYYDQWAAMGCVYAFAEGPKNASIFVEQMEGTDELLDWGFAEGGYLIDFDLSQAIVFGYPVEIDEEVEELAGEQVELVKNINAALDVSASAFLQHIAPNWAGWLLQWDNRGVDAFAKHLESRGITTIKVQPPSHPEDTDFAEFRA